MRWRTPAHEPDPTRDRQPLLASKDLTVEFATRRGTVQAVQHIDISVAKGETLGIVGESGSGKSVTSYAVMRILDRAGQHRRGPAMLQRRRVGTASEAEMRDLRGREMSMIFQNPRAALNPIRKVGRQIEDVLLNHVHVPRRAATAKAIEALRAVRIANPAERYHAYPFELSGGMCQRVVIALALACQPQLLIADEPTTGLDVTTQKAVMDLVVELARARHVDDPDHSRSRPRRRLLRPRRGDGEGPCGRNRAVADIFAASAHAYTRKLMRATPRPGVTLARSCRQDGCAGSAPLRSAALPLFDRWPRKIGRAQPLAGVRRWARRMSPPAGSARRLDAQTGGQGMRRCSRRKSREGISAPAR